MSAGPSILLVRMGAFGDVLHALPAAASLKRGITGARVAWVVEERWAPLLKNNPDVDEVIPFNRRTGEGTARIRAGGFDLAVDVQGLLKSALVAKASKAGRRIGFAWGQLREKWAALLYTDRVRSEGEHVVDRNLSLAMAAGASRRVVEFPLPVGEPEGELPQGRFVLTAPFAGWEAKQWPVEHYAELGRLLRAESDCELVVNVLREDNRFAGVRQHVSGLNGLIDATRRAAAIVGLDSGPMHLAAALSKPGVALFGPTDPARNGPYGATLRVMRAADAPTTYKRRQEILPCMRELTPRKVMDELLPCLAQNSPSPTPTR